MISTKNVLVLKPLFVSVLALTVSACDGGDGGDGAGTNSAPVPNATEESFDVTSVAPGADGKLQSTTVRMTDSQWQQIEERRNAALRGSHVDRSGDPPSSRPSKR